jgi:seryl-tRNA(Sec) selenium transferase
VGQAAGWRHRPRHEGGQGGILGLTHAIERYLAKEKESGAAMVAKMTPFIERLNQLPGVTAKVVWDSAGRDIARTDIAFDHQQIGMTTEGGLPSATGPPPSTAAATRPTRGTSR